MERKRLQTMLGFALATFFSILLAIALRGVFVRLFLIMALCLVLHVFVAAAIGTRDLRRLEKQGRARVTARAGAKVAADHRLDEATDQPVPERVVQPERSVLFPDPPPEIEQAEEVDLLTDLSEFGTGEFDDDFFEPIPELTFEPLNLDASILQAGDDPSGRSLFGPIDDDRSETRVGAAAGGPGDDAFDDFSDRDLFDEAAPVEAEAGAHEEMGHEEADVGHQDAPEKADGPLRAEATFTAPAQPRQRPPKRNKARPIYIESQLDDDDEQRKVVND